MARESMSERASTICRVCWLSLSIACVDGGARKYIRPEPLAPHSEQMAPPPRDPTYAGYLFTYFIGESSARGEQIYFALSRGNDPLSWQELNRGQPVLTSSVGTTGVRDPFIIRSSDGGRFFLIATDLKIYGDGNWDRAQRQGSKSIVVWESTDLVTWTDQRLVRVSADNAGNTWAPEAFYDALIGAYVIFWASKVYADDDPMHAGDTYNRMMYATTPDFNTFSEPKAWHDPGYSIIDSTVIRIGDSFYRFTKDERVNATSSPCGKFIRVETSLSLTDTEWDLVAECVGQGTVSRGEGPLVFKSNTEERWYLFIDEFGGRGYVPFESTDVRSGRWIVSPQYSLPSSPRHGTVLPVRADEYQRLLRAFAPD
jgi:Glycosyl hydrolases family 43